LIGSWQWGQSKRKETPPPLSVATYIRTGMATIPKLIAPRHIERGMLVTSSRGRRPRDEIDYKAIFS
jgi:hypothetical protein